MARKKAEPIATLPTIEPPKNQPAPNQVWTDEQIIAALLMKDGKVYLAAEHIGCHPDTIYERIKNVVAVRDSQKFAKEKLLDDAETSLHKAVREGEAWAVCFTLKCQAKHRGYVERMELTGAKGGKLDLSEVPDDELDAFNRVLASAVGANGRGSLPAGADRIAPPTNGVLPH